MGEIIVVFKSRADSIRFSEFISRGGVPSTLINTPRELSVACGISVSVAARYAEHVKLMLRQFGARSLLGVYRLERRGIRATVTPIQ